MIHNHAAAGESLSSGGLPRMPEISCAALLRFLNRPTDRRQLIGVAMAWHSPYSFKPFQRGRYTAPLFIQRSPVQRRRDLATLGRVGLLVGQRVGQQPAHMGWDRVVIPRGKADADARITRHPDSSWVALGPLAPGAGK